MSDNPLENVFFWRSENISLVTGETIEKPAQRWNARVVIALLRIVVGVLTLMLALIPALEQSRFLNSGVSTEGYYMDRWLLGDERVGEHYYLTYRFFVAAKDYTNRVKVSRDEYQSAEVGARVTVYYDADDPVQSTIYRSTIKADSINAATALIIFAIFVFGVILYYSWRQRLLQQEGQLIAGRVIHAKNEINRSGDYYLTVSYSFISPHTGQEIVNTIRGKQNERRAEPLPNVGQSVVRPGDWTCNDADTEPGS